MDRLQEETFITLAVAFPLRNRAVRAKHFFERLRIKKQPSFNMRLRHHADNAIRQIGGCLIDLFFPMQKSPTITIRAYDDEIRQILAVALQILLILSQFRNNGFMSTTDTGDFNLDLNVVRIATL